MIKSLSVQYSERDNSLLLSGDNVENDDSLLLLLVCVS